MRAQANIMNRGHYRSFVFFHLDSCQNIALGATHQQTLCLCVCIFLTHWLGENKHSLPPGL